MYIITCIVPVYKGAHRLIAVKIYMYIWYTSSMYEWCCDSVIVIYAYTQLIDIIRHIRSSIWVNRKSAVENVTANRYNIILHSLCRPLRSQSVLLRFIVPLFSKIVYYYYYYYWFRILQDRIAIVIVWAQLRFLLVLKAKKRFSSLMIVRAWLLVQALI